MSTRTLTQLREMLAAARTDYARIEDDAAHVRARLNEGSDDGLSERLGNLQNALERRDVQIAELEAEEGQAMSEILRDRATRPGNTEAGAVFHEQPREDRTTSPHREARDQGLRTVERFTKSGELRSEAADRSRGRFEKRGRDSGGGLVSVLLRLRFARPDASPQLAAAPPHQRRPDQQKRDWRQIPGVEQEVADRRAVSMLGAVLASFKRIGDNNCQHPEADPCHEQRSGEGNESHRHPHSVLRLGVSVLLRQSHGFEGLRMSQKVADANDLPRSKVKDFSDFLTELDAGRPGGQVHVTEREDRLAEVAELLGPIGEAFPRLAAVLPPNLSGAVMTSVGSCLSLKAWLDRRVPLDVGIELGQKGVQIIGIPRLDGALDGLHVLLRHRPRSIPQLRSRRSVLLRQARRAGSAGLGAVHRSPSTEAFWLRRVVGPTSSVWSARGSLLATSTP
jgi:hypothetical protein